MSRSALGATMSALLPPSSMIVLPSRPWTVLRDIEHPFASSQWRRPTECGDRPQAFARPIGPSPMSKAENRRIGAGFAADALGNFRHRDRGERRFFRRLPNRRVAADGGQRGVPRPDRDRKIEGGDHGDHTERMPLLHQAVARPFRLNRQAVKHARLADGEIADVDHLLHFAFALGDDLAGLERDELAEFGFEFAQRVAERRTVSPRTGPGVMRHFTNASCARVMAVS